VADFDMITPARKKIYAALALLILIAFAYNFFQSRGATPSELPVSIGGQPLHAAPNSTGQETPSSVKGKDQAVATQRKLPSAFYPAKSCYLTLVQIKEMQSASNCDRLAAKVGLESAYAECLKNWDDSHPLLDSAQRSFAKLNCGDEHNLFSKYYASTKEAAKSGNIDAQLCYLQSNFLDLESKPHYSPADKAEYQVASPKYIQDAFSRGDWRIVRLLSTDHHGGLTGLALYIPNIGDPDTVYKMTRLLRLGASGEYAEQLDSRLDDLAHPDGKENPELPQAKIAELDDWAQKTYSQYFAGAPSLTKPPYPCGIDVGTAN
jgi:hypothetical protein